MNFVTILGLCLASLLGGAALTLWVLGKASEAHGSDDGCIWQALVVLLLLAAISIAVTGAWFPVVAGN